MYRAKKDGTKNIPRLRSRRWQPLPVRPYCRQQAADVSIHCIRSGTDGLEASLGSLNDWWGSEHGVLGGRSEPIEDQIHCTKRKKAMNCLSRRNARYAAVTSFPLCFSFSNR